MDFAHEQNGVKKIPGGCAAAPGMYGALGWRELEDLGKNFPTSHYLSVITQCLFIYPEKHVNSASLFPAAIGTFHKVKKKQKCWNNMCNIFRQKNNCDVEKCK